MRNQRALYGSLGGVWLISAVYMNILYNRDGKQFMKQIVKTKWFPFYCLAPLGLGYLYYRSWKNNFNILYDKYAKDKSDIDLLKWELSFDPMAQSTLKPYID